MNEIIRFENPEFGEVRTLEEDGVVLFCGTDVARALGYSNPRDAIARHCKGVVKRDGVSQTTNQHGATTHQATEMSFIPESDLYRLVFRSKLPTAEKFTDWVTTEVLPSIRKHGAYMTPGTLEQALLSPDFLMQLAQKLKEEMTARKEAEMDRDLLCIELAQKQPMVDYFQACVEQNMLTNLRETAKLFSVGEKEFIRFLIDNRFLYRGRKGKLLPYATREDNSLFEVKEVYDEKTGWKGIQTFVTPRGRETLRLLISGKQESRLWGMAMPEPRKMTEKEEADCEVFYERQAKKQAKRTRK